MYMLSKCRVEGQSCITIYSVFRHIYLNFFYCFDYFLSRITIQHTQYLVFLHNLDTQDIDVIQIKKHPIDLELFLKSIRCLKVFNYLDCKKISSFSASSSLGYISIYCVNTSKASEYLPIFSRHATWPFKSCDILSMESSFNPA